MANTAIPRVRTQTSKIQSPISKCGDNWWQDVRVRSRYKKTDLAFRTLPSLGDLDQVESIDPEFPREMVEDFKRIRAFAKRHSSYLSARQQANIQEMLDRAKAYINDAETIWQSWAKGFTTPSVGQVPPWALNGQPKGSVDKNIEEGHFKDREKWQALVIGALRNLRCAEEVAKKATIRAHNKERHLRGRVFANAAGDVEEIADAPPDRAGQKTRVTEGQVALDELEGDDLEEGDIDLGEDGDTATSSKKKSSSLPLVLGAAALGALALAR